MDINIHNVTKITSTAPTKGSATNNYYRSIYIHTDKGEIIEIAMWAKKFSELLIKAEE